ncbi:MAG: Fe-S oxidoreductase [Methanosphaera stadtmanae]|nr:Fe-S oxidoreductase [Methanosphaera stadtmanae]
MRFMDWITSDIHKVLLVEPNFPIPIKSRNHSNFLPIGLLKIAAYLRSKSIEVKLIRHDSLDIHQQTLDNSLDNSIDFIPDLICVTSIFTYWSIYVKDAVTYYKKLFPNTPIIVGGVYASLLPQHCLEYTKCDDVITGILPEAEKLKPAYDLVDVDYQILHTTRGCIRKCGFCGVYVVEPDWLYKKTIKDEIFKKKIVFYDNNLLANPAIDNILDELIELKKEKTITYVESQSGFDGRLLINNPEYAKKMKEAGFKNPKIAWDHHYSDADFIHEQLNILFDVGFKPREISVFMIYNFDIDYNEMEDKRVKCFEWGVQITDCRFRPLDKTDDGYNPRKRKQSKKEYHINPNWTDEEVRAFRRNVRRHNICIRMDADYHSSKLERKQIPQDKAKEYRYMNYEEVKDLLDDVWTPKIPHYIKKEI